MATSDLAALRAPIQIECPDWLSSFLADRSHRFVDDSDRMRLVLDLTAEHLQAGTGGPFGAAVFASADGSLISVGVNLVEASRCSIAHAEMVAIGKAQQRVGSHDLREAVPGGCVLVSSAEPCAMCLGALPWSGISRLVCAARDADVRAIGFDEGHKPSDWVAGYARRGIAVTRDLMRAEAVALLRAYATEGGAIYGPSSPNRSNPIGSPADGNDPPDAVGAAR